MPAPLASTVAFLRKSLLLSIVWCVGVKLFYADETAFVNLQIKQEIMYRYRLHYLMRLNKPNAKQGDGHVENILNTSMALLFKA